MKTEDEGREERKRLGKGGNGEIKKGKEKDADRGEEESR